MTQNGFWQQMQDAAKFFSDFSLYALLIEMEQTFIQNMQNGETEGNSWRNIEFDRSGTDLNRRMADILPETVKHIAAHIRAHENDYLIIEE